ncbi:MAG: hypothetical protein K5838_08865, partial [Elusimicrobiales bacterium]|nr:hypothetical protein [Elusimicrobiales bacterium]
PFLRKAYSIICRSDLGNREKYDIVFNPLSVPTEAEQAATQGAKSSYYGNLINAGVVSPEEVRQALRQDENSGFTDIAEDLPEDTGGGMGGMPPQTGREPEGHPQNGDKQDEGKEDDDPGGTGQDKEPDYFYKDKNGNVHPGYYPDRLDFRRGGDVNAHFDNSETHKDWKKYIEQNKPNRNAIVYYTGPAHKELNEALRKGKDMDLKENPFLTTDQFIKTMYIDEAIAQYELERPMIVYRTLGTGIIDNFFESQDKIFPEYAYSSTSCCKNASILYKANTDLLIIYLPKGKGIGAYIADYSAFDNQWELLLKRKVNYKIVGGYKQEMYMWQKSGGRKLEKRRVFELLFWGDIKK